MQGYPQLSGAQRRRDHDVPDDRVEITSDLGGGNMFDLPTGETQIAIPLKIALESLEVAHRSVDLDPEPQPPRPKVEQSATAIGEEHLELRAQWETGRRERAMQLPFPDDLIAGRHLHEHLPKGSRAWPPASELASQAAERHPATTQGVLHHVHEPVTREYEPQFPQCQVRWRYWEPLGEGDNEPRRLHAAYAGRSPKAVRSTGCRYDELGCLVVRHRRPVQQLHRGGTAPGQGDGRSDRKHPGPAVRDVRHGSAGTGVDARLYDDPVTGKES